MFCTILLKYPFLFCMQTICITSSGAWKLGGFGFSIILDRNAVDSHTTGSAFHYPEYEFASAVAALSDRADEKCHFRSNNCRYLESRMHCLSCNG